MPPMISADQRSTIISIWDKYIQDNQIVLDTRGNIIDDIDKKRLDAIPSLQVMIKDYLDGKVQLTDFKSLVDSFNKRNNLWGFTSIKGQMFFNLLCRTEDIKVNEDSLDSLMKKCIDVPKDLKDALSKIHLLEKYSKSVSDKTPDRRKAPNPSSVGYFLSYFWQIQDPANWPVMFSSLIISFDELGIWQLQESQSESYKQFYDLNETIKELLTKYANRPVDNWSAEHAFWNYKMVTINTKQVIPVIKDPAKELDVSTVEKVLQASFNIYEFIPPVSARLIDLGNESEEKGSAKGSKFEKAVGEIFRQLGFEVRQLGQGAGREPDVIAVNKGENVAFIIDAKAYSNGYLLSTGDERAMREYIAYHTPKLKMEGIKKIGFLIVSNSFKPGFEDFINDITWNTEIKRFKLIQSNALLHLLAYKVKDQLVLSDIIEAIIYSNDIVTYHDIVDKFDDI